MATNVSKEIDFVGGLVRDLTSLTENSELYNFCGEASPKVYSNPLFKEAARFAYSRGAKLYFMTSPFLLADENGSNGIIDLRDEGVLTWYPRIFRGPYGHFRATKIGDSYTFWAEDIHKALEPLENRRVNETRPIYADFIERGAKQYIDFFTALIEVEEQKLPENALLVSEGNLRKLITEANAVPEGFFDYLTVIDAQQQFPDIVAQSKLIPYKK